MRDPQVLRTAAGDVPLDEIELELDGRAWRILHTGAILSHADEQSFLHRDGVKLPYGLVLWPAAIALVLELATRDLRDRRVLELGAGTGLPGIIAASLGATVVQNDRQLIVLQLCRINAERNGITSIEHRAADWTAWADGAHYDVILGSDILYAADAQPYVRRIFDTNLAPGGRVLVADPYRATSLALLEAMEADGWNVALTKWTVGATPPPRAVGVFELTPPHEYGEL